MPRRRIRTSLSSSDPGRNADAGAAVGIVATDTARVHVERFSVQMMRTVKGFSVRRRRRVRVRVRAALIWPHPLLSAPVRLHLLPPPVPVRAPHKPRALGSRRFRSCSGGARGWRGKSGRPMSS
eukprot:1326281-Rhodomonas_salina.2